MYVIKDPKTTIKRHHNQIRERLSDDMNNQKEEPMKIIYELYDVAMLLVASEEKSKRKWTCSGTMRINQKRKKIQRLELVVNSKKGMLWCGWSPSQDGLFGGLFRAVFA